MQRTAVLLVIVVAAPVLAGCFSSGDDSAWALGATQLAAMHESGRTGSGVRIAILDTGINVGHEALDHLVDGDDGDGELKAFRDFLGGRQGVEHAYDEDGHGSHVAGVISARGGARGIDKLLGGITLKGGAPDALLYVARVCSGESCRTDAVRNAVDWARTQNVDVITLSLGGPQARISLDPGSISQTQQQQALEDAINAAIDAGIVVVASAGNEGPDNDDVTSPADIPAMIAVGAVDEDRRVADFSSRGSGEGCTTNPLFTSGRCDPNKKPELVAPGVGIVSAWTGNDYVSASGTSQAAPFVAAVVATILEDKPRPATRSGVLDLKEALIEGAKVLAGQSTPHDVAAGYGLVQAKATLDLY